MYTSTLYFLWNRPIYFHYVYYHIIAHNMNIKWLNYFYWKVLASIANVCFRFEVCDFFLQYIGYNLLNLLWRLYFIHDLCSLKVTKIVYYFFMLYLSDKRNYFNFCFKKMGGQNWNFIQIGFSFIYTDTLKILINKN